MVLKLLLLFTQKKKCEEEEKRDSFLPSSLFSLLFQRIRVQQFDALNFLNFPIQKKIVLHRKRERERNLSAVARDFNQKPRATSLDLSFLSPVGFGFFGIVVKRERTRTYIIKKTSPRERERENSKRFSTFRTRVRRDSNFNLGK